jgi:DNA-binding CsgD family transcriptional regulator
MASENMRSAKVSVILADEMVRRSGLLAKRNGLTDRETEVLQQLIVGNTTRGIAEKLFVSENTVRTHLKSLYKKLGVHSKQEIIDMVDACEAV